MPSPQGPQEAAAGLPPNHPLAILASVSFRPGRRNSIPRQSSARQADPDTPSYPSRPPAPGRSLGEYLSPSHSEQSRGSWARGGGAGGGGGGGQHEREKWRLSSGPPERVREEGWAGGAGGAGSSIQVDRRLALSPAAAASISAISPFSGHHVRRRLQGSCGPAPVFLSAPRPPAAAAIPPSMAARRDDHRARRRTPPAYRRLVLMKRGQRISRISSSSNSSSKIISSSSSSRSSSNQQQQSQQQQQRQRQAVTHDACRICRQAPTTMVATQQHRGS